MKKTYGLIGFPLEHSFSKSYFTEKFKKEHLVDCSYENFPMEKVEGIRDLIHSNETIDGLNVTIPHKISVLPFLDELDEMATNIGSVNTIKIVRENGLKLVGYNTDVLGLMMALKPQLRPAHQRALILGNGGASKTSQYVLKTLGIDFLIVSRHPNNANEISYAQLNENHIRFHQLIINTTPLGMWPKTDELPPIPYEAITEQHLLFDLIYNPELTLFLQKGKEKGSMISNGLSMLYQQAEAAWKIWNRE